MLNGRARERNELQTHSFHCIEFLALIQIYKNTSFSSTHTRLKLFRPLCLSFSPFSSLSPLTYIRWCIRHLLRQKTPASVVVVNRHRNLYKCKALASLFSLQTLVFFSRCLCCSPRSLSLSLALCEHTFYTLCEAV